MGSTGWVRCGWCNTLVYNAYIPDGPDVPLCESCIGKFLEGQGPPGCPEPSSLVCERRCSDAFVNSFVPEQMFLNVVFLRPRNQQRTQRKFSETPFRSPGESSALIDAPGDLNSVRASPYPVPARRTPHRVVNESLRAQALTPCRSPGES